MVNEKGECLREGIKGENNEIGEEIVEKLLNSLRDFNIMICVQERFKILEVRIKVVKFDFKIQVEGLRFCMEYLKIDFKIVYCDIDLNLKKVKNSDEVSEIL